MNKIISIPVEETNDQVMRQLKRKIPLGAHKVDNLIPLQVFEKVSIRDGRIVHEKVTTVVWKIPFEEIRNEFIKNIYICGYKLMVNQNKSLSDKLEEAVHSRIWNIYRATPWHWTI